MVVGYHLIWTAYGTWLPNDPRGSSSHTIRNDVIAELGDLHQGRKRIQPASIEIKQFYQAARPKLRYEVRRFSPAEVRAIGDAFVRVMSQEAYTCYACSILSDHVHSVIRKHRDLAELMIVNLQNESLMAVLALGEREPEHPVWGGHGWKVFLEDQEDFERTNRYVEQNPMKLGLPAQQWSFVKPYDGWLPGIVSTAKPSSRNRKRIGRS